MSQRQLSIKASWSWSLDWESDIRWQFHPLLPFGEAHEQSYWSLTLKRLSVEALAEGGARCPMLKSSPRAGSCERVLVERSPACTVLVLFIAVFSTWSSRHWTWGQLAHCAARGQSLEPSPSLRSARIMEFWARMIGCWLAGAFRFQPAAQEGSFKAVSGSIFPSDLSPSLIKLSFRVQSAPYVHIGPTERGPSHSWTFPKSWS